MKEILKVIVGAIDWQDVSSSPELVVLLEQHFRSDRAHILTYDANTGTLTMYESKRTFAEFANDREALEQLEERIEPRADYDFGDVLKAGMLDEFVTIKTINCN